jgi:perosamine synthetase
MSWFVYTVRITRPLGRDVVMQKLQEAGIPSRPYFTPIHLQPFYRKSFGYERGDFPITEYLGDVTLALPFSGVMTEEQVDYVCAILRSVEREAQRTDVRTKNGGDAESRLNNHSALAGGA